MMEKASFENMMIVFHKKLQGQWRGEGSELWGAISLLFSISDCKENGEGNVHRVLWSNFLIAFNKKTLEKGEEGGS